MRKNETANFIYRIWEEWRRTIFFIVFVIIPVKSSLADWNWVPTGSMNPTILEGDLIYVNKVAAADIRASAQSLLVLVMGLGGVLGGLFTRQVVGMLSRKEMQEL